MNVVHKLKLDFVRRESGERIYAVQGDWESRQLEISLFEHGQAWTVPGGVEVLLRYQNMDGTGGVYDTLQDGSCAWSAQENVILWKLADQVLACPGLVLCQLSLMQGQVCLSSFTFELMVEPDPSLGTVESEAYYNWSRKFIEVPQVEEGQIIRVKTVDANGFAAQWEGVELPVVPDLLPNPHKLTFTGAASGSYDGREAVEVEIPEIADCSLYGLGVTVNMRSVSDKYALDSIRQTGWYSVSLESGEMDFGDGWNSTAFLLRVETGNCTPYENVTKQTAIFASYPGGEEYVRYCKSGSTWTQWERVIHHPKMLTVTGAVSASYDGSEAVNIEIPDGGGASRVLLWENADTISEFPGQTIQLNDLPDYDAIEVIYASGGFPGGYGRCYLSTGVLPKITDAMQTEYYPDGYALQSVADFYSPSGVRNFYRLFSWEETRISFEPGTYVDFYSGISTDNYCNIPARI